MARYRKLMPDHFSDKNLARISDRAHRVWCLMVTPLADDDGRFELDVEEILAKIYSFHREVCITEIESAIMELQKRGLVEVYEDGPGFLLCQLLDPWPEWAGVKGTSYYRPSSLPIPQQKNIIPQLSAEQLRNTYGTFRSHSAIGGGLLDLFKKEANARARGGKNVDKPVDKSSPAASAASFSKSKKKTPGQSTSAKSGPPDPIPFKNFSPISHAMIATWAQEFIGSQERDALNKICEHLNDLDRKFSLGKSKGGMDKPIGDPLKNLGALLRKRYGR